MAGADIHVIKSSKVLPSIIPHIDLLPYPLSLAYND